MKRSLHLVAWLITFAPSRLEIRAGSIDLILAESDGSGKSPMSARGNEVLAKITVDGTESGL
jgi:hypothetical protein